MPLHFVCPHCGSPTIVEDQFLGQSGPCFTCGKSITVPYSPISGLDAATSTVITRPATGRGSSIAVLIVVIAAGLVGGVAMLVLMIALLAPAVTAARTATQASTCSSNLAQIGQALQQYHTAFGSYPPATTTDAAGKAMHSWRVLILPYCGHGGLYQQYDFNQPWDSPTNMQVARRMPDIFACPADADAKAKDETSYMVVVGKGTAFPGDNKSVGMNDFKDGLSNTVLVVESATKGVSWTKPEDLDAATMQFAINGGKSGLGSGHPGGMHVLSADGKQHFVLESALPQHVEALITISGNDPVPWELISDDSSR